MVFSMTKSITFRIVIVNFQFKWKGIVIEDLPHSAIHNQMNSAKFLIRKGNTVRSNLEAI